MWSHVPSMYINVLNVSLYFKRLVSTLNFKYEFSNQPLSFKTAYIEVNLAELNFY